MFKSNTKTMKKRRRRDALSANSNRRRWSTLERLESRCVLAATLSGQVFDDLNGDQTWQPSAPNNEPALDCWTVFLDSNKNGELDLGEPQQLTDANGSYSFDVASPGEYSVELVQEPGFDRTRPIRFGLSTSLVEGTIQDHVFDPSRNVLYALDGDRVLRTDPITGDSLASLAIGNSLSSVDITPDGKFLIVGESTTAAGKGKLFKIDLTTNAVTTVNYDLDGDEGGVFDVAVVSNDRALFTTTSAGTDPVLLREVNLITNVATPRTETFGAGEGEVLPSSRLERNASRSAVLVTASQDPVGAVYLYETATDDVRSSELGDTLGDAHMAISRDGKLIAVQSATFGLKVFDDQFALVKDLPNFQGGVAFDSVRNILYAGDADTDEFVAIDSVAWDELYRVAAGEDLSGGSPYHEMQVHSRAKYLSLTTSAGMRYVQLDRAVPHVITVTDEETFDQLDFGNWANGQNRRPRGVGDSYTVEEDETLTITAPGVLGNDSDPDGNTLQTEFLTGATHGSLSLLPNGSFLYSPAQDYFGPDSFTYRPNDGTLSACRVATVNINVTPVNDAPTKIVLNTNTVNENETGVVIGEIEVVDVDQGEDQVDLQISDPRFEIDNGNRLRLRDGISLDHEAGTTITITVTATDTGSPNLSISEDLTIEVEDSNEFDPTIDTTTVDVPENSTTVGTVQVRDGDSTQTVEITIVGGNDGGIFSIDPNTGVISVNAGNELDHEGTQIHILTVSATDNVEPRRTVTGEVTISVTDVNESDPVIESAIFEVPENSAEGTIVGDVEASDADLGQSIVFSIEGGNDSGIFTIDSSTGVITVADGSQLDTEQSAQIVLTVQAADSGTPSRTSTANVTINVTNVNEFGPMLTKLAVTLDENSPNGTLVAVFPAFDRDAVSDLVFSIVGGNTDGAFSIDESTGEIRVANSSALDAEANDVIVLQIDVTDQTSPSLSTLGEATISLLDLNEFDPVATGGPFQVAVDAPIGFEVGTVTASDQDQSSSLEFEIIAGNDQGIFSIDGSTGVITISDNASLEGSVNSEFPITVQVSDGADAERTTTTEVIVSVVPANNNSPVAEDAVFSLAENSANGTVVGSVTATDADDGSTLTYSISSGNGNGIFSIDSETGEISVADAGALNFESSQSFTLTVVVDDGGTPSRTDEAQVTINLTDVNEFQPTLSDITRTLPENAANGTVVATLVGSDGDSNQSIIYSVSGTAFAINSTTGVLTVADGSQLNFESASSTIVTVTATDNGSPAKSTTANVIVNLTDLNEASPVIGNLAVSIEENRPAGTVLGQVTATDADTGQTVSFALTGGNAGGAFAINSTTGVITVANPSSIDAEQIPQFLLLVQAIDSGNPSRSAIGSVTVNVQGVNEAPVGVLLAGNNVPQHVSGAQVGLVSAVDPDAGDTHTFSIDDSRFTVTSARILKLNNGVSLTDAAGTTIPVQITVTDAGGLSASQSFIIEVGANPTPWQNPVTPLDVSGDGLVTPGDVLLVINEINSPSITDIRGRLPTERPDIPDTPFYDVNGDGILSPIDVLIIINELNRRAADNQAEGESSGFVRVTPANSGSSLPTSTRLASSFVVPAAVSFEIPRPQRSTSGRDLDDFEDSLDDLAEDVASAWGRNEF